MANAQEIALSVLALVIFVGGIVSCVLPPLPGPVVAFVGLVVGKFIPSAGIGWVPVAVWGGVVLVVTLADNFFSVAAVKRAGGTKAAIWGGLVGLLVGFFFGPVGILLGPLIGAIIGEYLATQEWRRAIRSGWWSFLGLLFGIAAKVAVCLSMMAYLVLKVVGAW